MSRLYSIQFVTWQALTALDILELYTDFKVLKYVQLIIPSYNVKIWFISSRLEESYKCDSFVQFRCIMCNASPCFSLNKLGICEIYEQFGGRRNYTRAWRFPAVCWSAFQLLFVVCVVDRRLRKEHARTHTFRWKEKDDGWVGKRGAGDVYELTSRPGDRRRRLPWTRSLPCRYRWDGMVSLPCNNSRRFGLQRWRGHPQRADESVEVN